MAKSIVHALLLGIGVIGVSTMIAADPIPPEVTDHATLIGIVGGVALGFYVGLTSGRQSA